MEKHFSNEYVSQLQDSYLGLMAIHLAYRIQTLEDDIFEYHMEQNEDSSEEAKIEKICKLLTNYKKTVETIEDEIDAFYSMKNLSTDEHYDKYCILSKKVCDVDKLFKSFLETLEFEEKYTLKDFFGFTFY